MSPVEEVPVLLLLQPTWAMGHQPQVNQSMWLRKQSLVLVTHLNSPESTCASCSSQHGTQAVDIVRLQPSEPGSPSTHLLTSYLAVPKTLGKWREGCLRGEDAVITGSSSQSTLPWLLRLGSTMFFKYLEDEPSTQG
jgi:hypothetical protein